MEHPDAKYLKKNVYVQSTARPPIQIQYKLTRGIITQTGLTRSVYNGGVKRDVLLSVPYYFFDYRFCLSFTAKMIIQRWIHIRDNYNRSYKR